MCLETRGLALRTKLPTPRAGALRVQTICSPPPPQKRELGTYLT